MKYLLFFTVLILPLRNIVEKFPNLFGMYGLGFINILFVFLFIGAVFSKHTNAHDVPYKPKLKWALIVYLALMFLQVFHGDGGGVVTLSQKFPFWKDLFFCMALYFVVRRYLLSRKDLIIILIVAAVSNIYMDSYYYRWVRWMNLANIPKMKLVNGTFGSMAASNEWAAFFAVYTLVTIGIAGYITNKKAKLFLYCLTGANILTLLFSYSRGAYVGFIAGLVIYFLWRKRIVFPAILAVILLFFAYDILPQSVLQRINNTTGQEGQLDADAASRITMWNLAWEGFARSPVIGNGLQSFYYYHAPDRKLYNNPHNTHLNTLYETGILGYLVFLWLFVAAFLDANHLYKTSPDPIAKGLAIGIIAATAALFVANLFGNRWTYLCLTSYFWILNGVIAQFSLLEGKTAIDKTAAVKEAVTPG
jgi:putative inorganic carbon (hco3(-)) transporter